jgi:hypothetical protein
MAELIEQEVVGEYLVSTVKLSMDHSFGGPVELWYETMIFKQGSWMDLYCERYETEEQSRFGHKKAVALAQSWKEGHGDV